MRRRYSAVELLAAVLLRCGACAVHPEVYSSAWPAWELP
jgi:hypothetical protein